MPDIASLHPQVIHLVVALGIVGVILRVVSLSGRLAWTRPAAMVLLVIAAGASVVAVESGEQAHEAAERIPGVREAVEEHQELGETTRTLFLVVAAVELVALALTQRPTVQRMAYGLSAAVGLVAVFYLYEASEHGGRVVYAYAGGVGTRSGDTADVRRLLIAGLFNEADVARKAGRPDEAARLTQEMARQQPDDRSIAVLALTSRFRDRHDTTGTLAALDSFAVPADEWQAGVQAGLLRADILTAAGRKDSARAVLAALAKRYPQSRRPQMALDRLR